MSASDSITRGTAHRRFGGRSIRTLAAVAVCAAALSGCSANDKAAHVPSSSATNLAAANGLGQSQVVLDPAAEKKPATSEQDPLKAIADNPSVSAAMPALKEVRAASSCSALVPLTANGYTALLKDLGAAKRTDTEAIDTAMERQGKLNELIDVRAEALGCDGATQSKEICTATASLKAGGEVGQDVLDRLRTSCA